MKSTDSKSMRLGHDALVPQVRRLAAGSWETAEEPPLVGAGTLHGWLLDGTKFDSSVDRGKPFDFRLSQVVPGWTEAMLGMKEGEKRKLVIPYALAYGRDGHGNIPPKATLVFDVELLEVLVE